MYKKDEGKGAEGAEPKGAKKDEDVIDAEVE